MGDPVLLACPSNRSRWKPWWKPWWCWLDLDSPKRVSNPLKVQVQAVCQLPGKRELRQKGAELSPSGRSAEALPLAPENVVLFGNGILVDTTVQMRP